MQIVAPAVQTTWSMIVSGSGSIRNWSPFLSHSGQISQSSSFRSKWNKTAGILFWYDISFQVAATEIIQVTPCLTCEFIHYTNEEGAEGIHDSGVIEQSTGAGGDAVFGPGTYVTTIGPNDASKEEIAENNWDDGNFFENFHFCPGTVYSAVKVSEATLDALACLCFCPSRFCLFVFLAMATDFKVLLTVNLQEHCSKSSSWQMEKRTTLSSSTCPSICWRKRRTQTETCTAYQGTSPSRTSTEKLCQCQTETDRTGTMETGKLGTKEMGTMGQKETKGMDIDLIHFVIDD